MPKTQLYKIKAYFILSKQAILITIFLGEDQMITALTHVSVFVADQDKALEFYKKLGFKVHTDTEFSGMRWLTITPANQPTVELSLMLADASEKALIGKQGGEKPFLCFATDDCRKTYAEFMKKGVQFLSEPIEEPWGVSTAFKDLDGNVFYMCQATN